MQRFAVAPLRRDTYRKLGLAPAEHSVAAVRTARQPLKVVLFREPQTVGAALRRRFLQRGNFRRFCRRLGSAPGWTLRCSTSYNASTSEDRVCQNTSIAWGFAVTLCSAAHSAAATADSVRHLFEHTAAPHTAEQPPSVVSEHFKRFAVASLLAARQFLRLPADSNAHLERLAAALRAALQPLRATSLEFYIALFVALGRNRFTQRGTFYGYPRRRSSAHRLNALLQLQRRIRAAHATPLILLITIWSIVSVSDPWA